MDRLLLLLLPLASLLLSLLGAPAPSGALSLALSVEFDAGPSGDFGEVEVVQNGDDLDFIITAGPDLGPSADLHELYFNLVGSFTGLAITADDAPSSSYSLLFAPSIGGGAGSSFEFGVNFGNGAGPPGNGVLQAAMFTLSADQALVPEDLLQLSSTNNAGPVHVAAHFQGTSFVSGSTSETVGGIIPEPGTALLLAGGVAALALAGGGRAGRRRRRS